MTNAEIDTLVLQYVRENQGGRVHVLQKALAGNVPNPRINISRSLQRLKRRGKVRCDRGHWDAAEEVNILASAMRVFEAMPIVSSPSPWQSTPPTAEQVRASIGAFILRGNPDFDPGYAPWWCRRDGSPRIVDLTVEMDAVCLFEDGEPITMRHFGTEGEWMPVALPPRMEAAQ